MERLGRKGGLIKNAREHYQLYLLALPAVIYVIIFCYVPMYGVQIAFRDYFPGMSMLSAKWVGLYNFSRFFRTYMFQKIVINTLRISLMSLILGFPAPVALAIMLNNLKSAKLRRTLQMISYAPYFISAVSMAGMMLIMLSERGVITRLFSLLGSGEKSYLGSAGLFPIVYVLSNLWKNSGWNSVIYCAALSGVDTCLYEAARIDGANRLQIIRHVDLPSIMPTMVVLLILNCGQLMSVGWEQILLLQNPLNTATSEIISTYTYKVGLLSAEYSYSAAIGLLNSLVNLLLLALVNCVARKAGDTSLW